MNLETRHGNGMLQVSARDYKDNLSLNYETANQ